MHFTCWSSVLNPKTITVSQLMTHAGKLDHIGVEAYSTLAGARHFCPRLRINKIPEFYIIFARKNNKIPEFYTWHLPQNARILHYIWPKNILFRFFWGKGAGQRPSPSPTPTAGHQLPPSPQQLNPALSRPSLCFEACHQDYKMPSKECKEKITRSSAIAGRPCDAKACQG